MPSELWWSGFFIGCAIWSFVVGICLIASVIRSLHDEAEKKRKLEGGE